MNWQGRLPRSPAGCGGAAERQRQHPGCGPKSACCHQQQQPGGFGRHVCQQEACWWPEEGSWGTNVCRVCPSKRHLLAAVPCGLRALQCPGMLWSSFRAYRTPEMTLEVLKTRVQCGGTEAHAVASPPGWQCSCTAPSAPSASRPAYFQRSAHSAVPSAPQADI